MIENEVSEDDLARIPRLAAGCDPTKMKLSPGEGFLLSRIDGQTTWKLLREIGGELRRFSSTNRLKIASTPRRPCSKPQCAEVAAYPSSRAEPPATARCTLPPAPSRPFQSHWNRRTYPSTEVVPCAPGLDGPGAYTRGWLSFCRRRPDERRQFVAENLRSSPLNLA